MPSPFPGMDPYLEGREWTSVHAELAAEIARQLAPKLRPKYTARVTRRFVMDTPESIGIMTSTSNPRTTYPDIGIYPTSSKQSDAASSATAVAPPLQLPTTITEEMVPVHSVEIRDTTERELITAIEILSPANKRGDGYIEYKAKRSRILHSPTHLLEIDLLRRGKRIPMEKPLPEADYFVFLTRAENRPMTGIWPLTLADKLPIVPIPLLSEDDDVLLDLQQALTSAYDAYGYDLSLDYSQLPDIPFTEAEAHIAQQILQSQQ